MLFSIFDATTSVLPAATMQGGQGQGDPMTTFIMMGVIFVVFYLLILRPQSKRMKEHKSMVEAVSIGNEVLVNGLLGKVTSLHEQFVTVEMAKDVQINVQRHAITAMVPKGTMKSVTKTKK